MGHDGSKVERGGARPAIGAGTAANRPQRLLLVMRPPLAATLANALRDRLGCDVTVAHHLRTAWSLTTAHASDPAGQVASLRRWGAIIAQGDLDDGPGLALLSHARSVLPSLPTILLDVDEDHLVAESADPIFVTGRVRFTNLRDTALALIAAMGQPPVSLEPSVVGPRPPVVHEPLGAEAGPRPFASRPTSEPGVPRRRGAPFRWR